MSNERRFVFAWTCPVCGRSNEWDWPAHDRPGSGTAVLMSCEFCAAESKMTWTGECWERGAA